MIVPMSKLSVLIYYKEKTEFLRSLQEIGIIHIVENQEVEQADAVSETYKSANEHCRACDQMIKTLSKKRKEIKSEEPQAKVKEHSEEQVLHIIHEFEKAEQQKEALLQGLVDLEKDIKQLLPWGELDPEIIGNLEMKGIKLRFFEANPKKLEEIDLGDHFVEEIDRDKNKVRLMILEKDQVFSSDEMEEVNLPIKSLRFLQKEKERIQEELMEVEKVFERQVIYIDLLKDFKVNSRNVASYAAADTNMAREVDGKAFSLTGWFPTRREKMVNDFLEDYICYYKIEKPHVDDNVPILLKNNRFTRLFEPITNIYSLPSYREIDPTPFFAPFFVVYFGLCLGDLGYGIITTLLAGIAFFKVPKQFRNFAIIGLILGIMTMLSGIALNSLFGESIFYLKGNKEYLFRSEMGALVSFLGSYINIDNLTVFPAMGFAIFLGVVQVLLGIILQCYNRIRQFGFVWGLHPASFFIIITGLLFTLGHGDKDSGFKGITGIDITAYELGPLHIGSWLIIPPIGFGLFLVVAGLLIMFLFNNPDKNIFLRPLFGLWELYGFATGIVGDILSYLRLFALGLASGLLGNAFNGIAFGFIENSIFPGIIATVLLLLFAHVLNFGLAILGSFVHPLRLTFVEFYKNLDFEGGGKSYSPFLKEKAQLS